MDGETNFSDLVLTASRHFLAYVLYSISYFYATTLYDPLDPLIIHAVLNFKGTPCIDAAASADAARSTLIRGFARPSGWLNARQDTQSTAVPE